MGVFADYSLTAECFVFLLLCFTQLFASWLFMGQMDVDKLVGAIPEILDLLQR